MKLSNSFLITRKELPKDESSISGKLLIKSGMIHKNNNGIYTYLPLGFKVLENIKKIIREEMKKCNHSELLLPTLVEEKTYDNRKKNLEPELFKIIDKNTNHFCLSPSDDELMAMIGSLKIKSYKDLHFSLYQINNKYRDEDKVKDALVRRKEYILCDAYSFDSDVSGLEISYDNMYHIFNKVFKRLNLDFLTCLSNPSNLINEYSEEFHIKSESGDEQIVKCTSCSYTCNRETAAIITKKPHNNLVNKKIAKVYTPNVKTIDEVSDFLHINEDNIIKSLIYKIDGNFTLVLMRGNDEVSLTKLKIVLKCHDIELASEDEITNIGGYVGYVGPIKATMRVIADNSIKLLINAICGSNEKNYHFINVTPGIDFKVDKYADIKRFSEDDICPICKNKVDIVNTMEIANIYKLGTYYSEIFDLKYSNEQNEYNRVYMGAYSLGIDRCISAIVEHNHDENGIIWPIDVSPFKVAIVLVNPIDKDASKYANGLYDKLNSLGIETLLDDRKESVGIKFKDIDLIGIPIRITIGYKLNDNIIELKLRAEKEGLEYNTIDIISKVQDILGNNG